VLQLDHIAYRVKDKWILIKELMKLGYRPIQHFNPLPEVTCTSLKHDTLPGIFVSSGGMIEEWVNENGEGIHHIAIRSEKLDKLKVFSNYTTENPITCPGLSQMFTKPICGVTIEILERDDTNPGFCEQNVKELMESTYEETTESADPS